MSKRRSVFHKRAIVINIFNHVVSKMHETVNVIVTIGEEYKDNLVPVTEELTKCGMSISQVMSNIGVVAGSIANENIHIVKQIQGVMQVEEDRAYQIAPPDSVIQ